MVIPLEASGHRYPQTWGLWVPSHRVSKNGKSAKKFSFLHQKLTNVPFFFFEISCIAVYLDQRRNQTFEPKICTQNLGQGMCTGFWRQCQKGCSIFHEELPGQQHPLKLPVHLNEEGGGRDRAPETLKTFPGRQNFTQHFVDKKHAAKNGRKKGRVHTSFRKRDGKTDAKPPLTPKNYTHKLCTEGAFCTIFLPFSSFLHEHISNMISGSGFAPEFDPPHFKTQKTRRLSCTVFHFSVRTNKKVRLRFLVTQSPNAESTT